VRIASLSHLQSRTVTRTGWHASILQAPGNRSNMTYCSVEWPERCCAQVHNAAAESKQLEQFLHDPTVPRETKIAGLDAVLDAMKVSDLTKRFLGAPFLVSTS